MTREVCEHFNPVDLPCDKCKEKRKSEALFLADELEIPLGTVIGSEVQRRAAAELRRLHAELGRCKTTCDATAECWRLDAEQWKAQRDALLRVLKDCEIALRTVAKSDDEFVMARHQVREVRAAIKAAEENT